MKKNGKIGNKQRFKCHICGKQFVDRTKINSQKLWEEYTKGKQTYRQLAIKFNCSIKTIQRKLDEVKVLTTIKTARKVVVLMDTTYWGRKLGVMLFKDAITKENLLKYYVKSETNALYLQGINELKSKGFEVVGIVCDGRRGLISLFENIPVQFCQFHQVAILRRYLTKKPKMKAAQELLNISDLMKQTDKESFEGALKLWYEKWEDFLNQRTINSETNKSHYTHKRLRSAYRSLANNLPWLFTWYDNPDLNIPTTTNAIEGHFSDLKNKLRNHNGLSLKRKMRFIDEFLKA